MSVCTAEKRPILWQRQPRIPVGARRCLRVRLEAALEAPARRSLLVWPVLLGAPRFMEQHPGGIPEAALLEKAAPMLRSLGCEEPPQDVFRQGLALLPDTAAQGAAGWLPHPDWAGHADVLSLRAGVALLALMGLPTDERYRLQAGVALFNEALFHESHDAFEALWKPARGRLRGGLQGLILLAGGYHHQQLHNLSGMQSLWRSALEALLVLDGRLETPWGAVDFSAALEASARRLAWLEEQGPDGDGAGLWTLPRPTLEVMHDA